MKHIISLKNTSISFIPSFSGNGWETSLMPRFQHKYCRQHAIQINLQWLKTKLSKMQKLGQGGGVVSWTTAIARLFL